MFEVVHVAVWLLVLGAGVIGGLVALAVKNKVSVSTEVKTVEGEAVSFAKSASADVQGFDPSIYSTIKALEAEGKADVGSAVKYVEHVTGLVLKKI